MSVKRTITGGKEAVLAVIDERIAEHTLDEKSKAVLTKKSIAEFHYMVQGLKLARDIVEDCVDLNG